MYTPPQHDFKMPNFSLPTVNGEKWESHKIVDAPAKVIVFMCNHCPYVKAIESRLIQLARDLKAKGVPLVGICSNDATEYPEDSPAELKKRWTEQNYGFDYLLDEAQTVAKEFDAVCTPDFFVFDDSNKLFYRGRLDDSWKDPSKVTRQDLKLAVEAILQRKPLDFKPSPSMGCSIKWK